MSFITGKNSHENFMENLEHESIHYLQCKHTCTNKSCDILGNCLYCLSQNFYFFDQKRFFWLVFHFFFYGTAKKPTLIISSITPAARRASTWPTMPCETFLASKASSRPRPRICECAPTNQIILQIQKHCQGVIELAWCCAFPVATRYTASHFSVSLLTNRIFSICELHS